MIQKNEDAFYSDINIPDGSEKKKEEETKYYSVREQEKQLRIEFDEEED